MTPATEPAFFSLQSPEFWFGVASLVVIALAWKPLGKILAGMLDSRADKIRAEIAQAEALLAEAKTLFARYSGALQEAEAEAERIIAQAKNEAEQIHARMAQELEHSLAARRQHILDRMTQAEKAATAEIRDAAVTLTMQASRNALRMHTNDNQHSALVQKAIDAVKQNLR